MQKNKIEARLLYPHCGDLLSRVDIVALRALIRGLDVRVSGIGGESGAYLLLRLPGARLVIAWSGAPLALNAFRGVTRPAESDAARRDVLRRLAGHRSCVTVLAFDHGPAPMSRGLKQRLVWEVTDYLLTLETPDLVQCPGPDRLMTADEAEDWLLGLGDRMPGFSPGHSAESNARKEIFLTDPELSPQARDWLGKRGARAAPEDEDILGEALRAFLDHKTGPDARALRDTAAGRSALYVMSATIMLFALPLGASALTYNALGGGSVRMTAYAMAATGMGSMLDRLGLTDVALAVMQSGAVASVAGLF